MVSRRTFSISPNGNGTTVIKYFYDPCFTDSAFVRGLPKIVLGRYPRIVISDKSQVPAFQRYNFEKYRLDRTDGACETASKRRKVESQFNKVKWIGQQLAGENHRLPWALARRFLSNHRYLDLGELVGEANLALLRSVESFNPFIGIEFSTYAGNSMINAFARVSQNECRRRRRFPNESGLSPLTFSDAAYREFLAGASPGKTEVHLGPENIVYLMGAAGLTPNETVIIQKRFPCNGKPETLEEIGQRINVTKERVRQLQIRALAKMREALEAHL